MSECEAQPLALLVCAATLPELQAYDSALETGEMRETAPFLRQDDTGYLLTGVGIPAALPSMLSRLMQWRPALILNIGIAGAYPNSAMRVGDLVTATSELYGDLGFELPEPPDFQSLSESRFAGTLYANPFPLVQPQAWTLPGIRKGRGCTVNACAGTERMGLLRERLFEAHFETMEGAAIAQIGQQFGIPVCEIRAISNIAARRDMRFENIRSALNALRDYLLQCRSLST
jgi:futalosine hydrolase